MRQYETSGKLGRVELEIPRRSAARSSIFIYYKAYATEKLARIREQRLKHNSNALRELKKRIGLTESSFFGHKGRSGAGFTLIEIIVTLAIMTILAGAGALAGLDVYKRYLFWSERDTVLSLLHQARSGAMHNIGGTGHGFRVDLANFVEFQGSTYASRDTSKDFIMPRNTNISASGLAEVDFAALSGAATVGTISLADGQRNVTITINNAGEISW